MNYLPKAITSLFTKKVETDFTLQHHLKLFTNCRVSNGELTEQRLREYSDINTLISLNLRSTVKADGLDSVFYSRYFTFHHLTCNGVGQSKPSNDLINFVKSHPPSKIFRNLTNKEIEYCEDVGLSDNSTYQRDSYAEVIR